MYLVIAVSGICIGLVLFIMRCLRWFGVLQQKEYRWDRIGTFLSSTEGMSELFHLLPSSQEFSRTGLKRPKITPRIVGSMVGLVFELLTISYVAAFVVSAISNSLFTVLVVSFLLVVVYICIPLLIFVTAIPTSLIARWQTKRICARAAQKLQKHKPLVIGITGSYGKSSLKQLLAYVLQKKHTVFATPRSFNTRYSVAKSIVDGYKGEKIVILEYGAYGPGEIRQLARDLPPSWAVITGFAPQHLGLFGSEEAIVQAKAELLTALPSGAKAFVAADDPGVQRIVAAARMPEDIAVTKYTADSVTWLKKAKLTKQGFLELPQAGEGVETQLVGLHYTQTIAGAVAVAQALEITESDSISRIKTFKPSSTFIHAKSSKSGVWVIDDGGTSNPKGFAAAVALLGELEYPQKVLLTPGIVDLGERSDDIHRLLAEQAWESGVSEVLCVGPSAVPAFTEVFGPARVLTDRMAIRTTLRSMPSGSVLLIEGRMPGWCASAIDSL